MSKADELLAGRFLNRETFYRIEKEYSEQLGITDSGCISALKRDPVIAEAVDELRERLLKLENTTRRAIPAEESEALQRERVLDFDFICQCKKDPRYFDPARRDKQYVEAVEAACRELTPGTQAGPGGIRAGVAEKKTLLGGNYE